jgi:hypothetical protein
MVIFTIDLKKLKTETDTCRYHQRSVNNQRSLYTDQNSFDSNRVEEDNTREWKHTPIDPRAVMLRM